MPFNQNVNNAFSNYDGLQERFEILVENAVTTLDDDLKKECEAKFVAKLSELVSDSNAHDTTDMLMTHINLAKTDIIKDIKRSQDMRDILNVDNYTNIERVKKIPRNDYLRRVIKKNNDEGKSQQVRRQPLQRKSTSVTSRQTENGTSPPSPPRPKLIRR